MLYDEQAIPKSISENIAWRGTRPLWQWLRSKSAIELGRQATDN